MRFRKKILYRCHSVSTPFIWIYIHKADQSRTINAIQRSVACTAERLSPTVPRQPYKSLLRVGIPCTNQLRVCLASLPECFKKMTKQDRKKSSCRAEDSAEVLPTWVLEKKPPVLETRQTVWPSNAKCLLVFSQLHIFWKPAPTPSGLLCAALNNHRSASLSRHIYLLSPDNTTPLIPYLTAEPCLS